MGGFHGRTLGSLGFTASKAVQRRGFMPIQGVTHIPYPYAYRPLLAAQPDEEDYGETVINYLKKTVFKSLVAPKTWRRSWSSQSRAKAAMLRRRPPSSRCCVNCATNMASC